MIEAHFRDAENEPDFNDVLKHFPRVELQTFDDNFRILGVMLPEVAFLTSNDKTNFYTVSSSTSRKLKEVSVVNSDLILIMLGWLLYF